MPAGARQDFGKLVKALTERFSPETQTEQYRTQLKERQWKHDEDGPEFGQKILKRTKLAYPGVNASLFDSFAIGNFIDAILDPEMHINSAAKAKSV